MFDRTHMCEKPTYIKEKKDITEVKTVLDSEKIFQGTKCISETLIKDITDITDIKRAVTYLRVQLSFQQLWTTTHYITMYQ